MRRAGRGALVALTLLGVPAHAGQAQDSTVAVRHLLSLDISRVQPIYRTYDMIVRARDSSVVIGQRAVVVSSTVYAGMPAWLVVETRTGVVPAIESLYVAPDLRPLHWSSALGGARLGAEFVGDSIYGATTMQAGKQNVVVVGRPDLLVSSPMAELLLSLLPLTAAWADSVGVLTLDLASNQVSPAELVVVEEEELLADSAAARPSWVVNLRAGPWNVLYWIEKATGVVLRIQQPLPPHVGSELEYRLRAEVVPAFP